MKCEPAKVQSREPLACEVRNKCVKISIQCLFIFHNIQLSLSIHAVSIINNQ